MTKNLVVREREKILNIGSFFFLIHGHMKECDTFRSFQGVLGLLEDSQKEMNRDEPRRVCYGAVLGMIK